MGSRGDKEYTIKQLNEFQVGTRLYLPQPNKIPQNANRPGYFGRLVNVNRESEQLDCTIILEGEIDYITKPMDGVMGGTNFDITPRTGATPYHMSGLLPFKRGITQKLNDTIYDNLSPLLRSMIIANKLYYDDIEYFSKVYLPSYSQLSLNPLYQEENQINQNNPPNWTEYMEQIRVATITKAKKSLQYFIDIAHENALKVAKARQSNNFSLVSLNPSKESQELFASTRYFEGTYDLYLEEISIFLGIDALKLPQGFVLRDETEYCRIGCSYKSIFEEPETHLYFQEYPITPLITVNGNSLVYSHGKRHSLGVPLDTRVLDVIDIYRSESAVGEGL